MKKNLLLHPVRSHLPCILLAASLTAGILTGCGASRSSYDKGSGAQVFSETAAETAAAAMDMDTMNTMNTMDTMAGSYEENESALTSSGTISATQTRRKLIRNVDLNVETTDFDQLIQDITQSVQTLGGYIQNSNISGSSISGSSGRRFASYTARIPADKLDGFITQVSEQGNVTNKSEYTQDVTLQYSDIESRKKSLTIEQERLWALLEKADTLEAVIALEERLSEIRYQLESFESQLRTYDNQVDYSTVSIYIDEVQVLTPTAPDSVSARIQKGFRRNLEFISATAVNVAVSLLSGIPTLAILALFLGIVICIVRKLRHRTRQNPADEDPDKK